MQQHGGGVRRRLEQAAQKLFGRHRALPGQRSGYFTIGEDHRFRFADITDGPHGITEDGWRKLQDASFPVSNQTLGRHRVNRRSLIAS